MARRIRITVEVELADLSDEERAECARLDGCSPEALPTVDDYEAYELTGPLVEGLSDDAAIWEGTGVYARVAKVDLLASEEIEG